MAHLEFPVREFEKLNPKNFDSFKIYEETIKSNNSQLFENTLRKINSSGQYLDSKNLERIYRNLK